MTWWRDLLAVGGPVRLDLPVSAATSVAATDATMLAKSRPAAASHHPRWGGVRTLGSTRRTHGLTPQRLAGYLRAAEDGDPLAQAEMLTEIEGRDTRLLSVLSTRKRALAGLPWRVVPSSDRRTDVRIARYVHDVINEIPQLRTAIIDMMDAVAKGYSGLEIDWRQGGGATTIAGLVHRPAQWFRPSRERPDQWVILTDSGGEEPLQPGAWVWNEMRALSGSTVAGGALGRALAWVFLFRSMSLKDWLIFSETYGAPLRVGRYRPGTSETDQAVLFQALRHLGVDTAAMLPSGCDIEFPEVKGRTSSVDVYKGLVEWGASEYAVAVLGQTLTTSEGQHGTQALGSVHADVRQDLLESDAAQVSETLTRCLVWPLVTYQFGPQARFPKFQLIAEPPEDLAARADLYAKLSKLGVRFAVDHVHEAFGVPRPAEGEETYGAAQQTALPGGSERASDGARSDLTDAGCGHHHALTDGEPDALEADVRRAVQQALDEGGFAGWERVVEHLRAHVMRATAPGEVSQRLLAALRELDLTDLAREVADATITGELLGRLQVAQDDRPVGDWPKVPPRQAMDWWRAKVPMLPSAFRALDAEHRARGFTVARFTCLQAVAAIAQLQAETLADGLTMAQFEDRFDDALGRYGMASSSPWHVQLVFRNNVHTAYHGGRWHQQRRPESRARRPYLLYDALDGARQTHAEMDGRVYLVDDPIWGVWYPLNGHNCRCRVRALTAAEVAQLGLVVSTGLPRFRHQRADGRVVVEPLLPDAGFQRNPAMEPHEFDFGRFPEEWRDALGTEEVTP